MSDVLCICPDDEILVSIPDENCPFDMDQIQRMAFSTQGNVIWDSADGTGTGLAGVPQVDSQIDTLADWQARLTSNAADKIVVTPRIGGDPIITPGDQITEGGDDNTTFDGVTESNGKSPSTFTVVFKSLSPAQERALQDAKCKNLEVYFFLKGGRIACASVNVGGATLKGFNVYSYFMSDRQNDGFASKDKHNMSFQLQPGWSRNLVIVDPVDFNPIYDL